jgi:hypothetical protein
MTSEQKKIKRKIRIVLKWIEMKRGYWSMCLIAKMVNKKNLYCWVLKSIKKKSVVIENIIKRAK